MKLEFKPEDFNIQIEDTSPWPREIQDGINALLVHLRPAMAKCAQRRLAEMLKDAPVVYGTYPTDLRGWGEKESCDTHCARLVCIEEIKA